MLTLLHSRTVCICFQMCTLWFFSQSSVSSYLHIVFPMHFGCVVFPQLCFLIYFRRVVYIVLVCVYQKERWFLLRWIFLGVRLWPSFPVEVPLFIGTRSYLCNSFLSAKQVGVPCCVGKYWGISTSVSWSNFIMSNFIATTFIFACSSRTVSFLKL